ncbi:formimidoylglutamase [Herbaspirillum sp. RV1423]|uniref:formimidoylglutamase n=1 Tax=Herbaspirillum sp. RV1423 TaxID=1443993 RepID=UPI0004AFDF31|nr:formimidoylglutamase [Herbaspirillum sp. RV1423]
MDHSLWNGRLDHDSAGDTRRLHQLVKPFDCSIKGGGALIGFACDEGVRRNHGRVGAAQGPDAIRRMLANLPAHRIEQLADAGNIDCHDGELEQAQQRLAAKIADVKAQGVFPLVLGGGHEVAYGSFLGIMRHIGRAMPQRKLLIVNFDAHFDLREAERSTSGTPFRQMAEWCEWADLEFHYLCYGISQLGNTPALFKRAQQLNVEYVMDTDVAYRNLAELDVQLRRRLQDVTDVYLTIDLDVLPGEKAPGVSAPAAFGMALEKVEKLVATIKASGKLIAADIAECNPVYDRDGLTAKVAARLAHLILQPD